MQPIDLSLNGVSAANGHDSAFSSSSSSASPPAVTGVSEEEAAAAAALYQCGPDGYADVEGSYPVALLVGGDKSPEQRLLDLSNAKGVAIVQRNGQRIFGGPPAGWTGPAPGKGCEVFVGKVPRDCYEDELVPVFERVAPIYELRLMMDFSGSNRGFCFVRYAAREDARRAVQELDNFEIRPYKRLGVLLSVDNRKLWISGIPRNYSAEQIKVMFKLYNPRSAIKFRFASRRRK